MEWVNLAERKPQIHKSKVVYRIPDGRMFMSMNIQDADEWGSPPIEGWKIYTWHWEGSNNITNIDMDWFPINQIEWLSEEEATN